MKTSEKEKYVGDIVHFTGKIKATVDDRVARGHGITTEIFAFLDEIPLGRYRISMGLKLRQARLVNGMLFSSEGWHGVSMTDVKLMEKVDEKFFKNG